MRKTVIFFLIIGIILFNSGGSVFAQTANLTGYYVNVGGQSTGPHDTASLRRLVNQGQLNSDTLVWKEGMRNWVKAGTVTELKPLLAPAGPPPLPAAQVPPPIPESPAQKTVPPEQQWFNSYAPGLETNNIFVNAGIGYGPTKGYNMAFPPVSVSVDVKLPITTPITLGAIAVFNRWKYSIPLPYNMDVSITNIGIGVRGMYHFNFMNNLDTYAGITLGWVFQNASVSHSSGISYGDYAGNSFFLWGANIGARYFFTETFGAYAELGYSGLQYLNVGLTMKLPLSRKN